VRVGLFSTSERGGGAAGAEAKAAVVGVNIARYRGRLRFPILLSEK
jgi:hypothetical protein